MRTHSERIALALRTDSERNAVAMLFISIIIVISNLRKKTPLLLDFKATRAFVLLAAKRGVFC